MVAEWPFRENGAERIYTASIKVSFCNLKCVLKAYIGQNRVVSSLNMIKMTPYNVEKQTNQKQKIDKMTPR